MGFSVGGGIGPLRYSKSLSSGGNSGSGAETLAWTVTFLIVGLIVAVALLPLIVAFVGGRWWLKRRTATAAVVAVCCLLGSVPLAAWLWPTEIRALEKGQYWLTGGTSVGMPRVSGLPLDKAREELHAVFPKLRWWEVGLTKPNGVHPGWSNEEDAIQRINLKEWQVCSQSPSAGAEVALTDGEIDDQQEIELVVTRADGTCG